MFEQVAQPRSRWRAFWPDVSDVAGADEAIVLGRRACFVVAALTLAAAAFGALEASFVDGLVFAALGAGLGRRWRTAAVMASLLFTVNLVLTLVRGGGLGVLGIIAFFCIVGSVRGTFAYRRILRRAAALSGHAPSPGGEGKVQR
jgi:hypothetical protein